jgi:hypothetical protein
MTKESSPAKALLPTKIGTTRSPRRYNAAADETTRPHNLRRTAILRYASWIAVFPISRMVRFPSIAAVSINQRERRRLKVQQQSAWNTMCAPILNE